MRIAVAAVVMSAVMGTGSPAADQGSFAVIVASANPMSSIRRQELAHFFLKKTTRWSDGRIVIPVDQSTYSPVRSAFTRAVLSIEGLGQISAVQNFWLQQVYSGRNTPPPVKATDAEIVAFIASNPGAIGYVAVGASPAAKDVKILAVTD